MPKRGRSRSRSRSTKRRRRSRARSRGGYNGYISSRSFLPKVRYTTLVYSETISLATAAAGALTTYTFNANGLWDPNQTGVGHQPRGFDQMMSLYKRYRVTGASITVGATNPNAAAVALCVMSTGTNLALPTALASDVPECGSMGLRYKHLWGNTSGGKAAATVRSTFSLRKELAGRTASDEYGGDSGANPTQKMYFVVGNGFIDSAAGAGNAVKVAVKIRYRVRFHDPNAVGQS